MRSMDPTTVPENLVTALFADRALSFTLSKGATFADLADRVGHLSEWHTDMPTGVFLKFAMAREPAFVRQTAI